LNGNLFSVDVGEMPLRRKESMDQKQGEAFMSDAATKVGDIADDPTTKTQETIQDSVDHAKPVLRDLRESAGAAMDKATDLAQRASAAGVQAVDAVQDAARDVANQASQTATAIYQQGARAGGSVGRYAAEQPLTALLVAAAIGYGIAYLIHRP
jgi:ElaB/YqjD/DUF883 family membrane-anchored ribosome-binding protein